MGKDWPSPLAKDDDELEVHYRHTLEELGKCSGMLGLIFRKAQNKIQDPEALDLRPAHQHALHAQGESPQARAAG
jgi:hypothetical protein